MLASIVNRKSSIVNQERLLSGELKPHTHHEIPAQRRIAERFLEPLVQEIVEPAVEFEAMPRSKRKTRICEEVSLVGEKSI